MKKQKPQSVEDYGFTGMFIPANLCLSGKLKPREVDLLVLIDALDKGAGAEVGNEWLATRIGTEVRRVQQMLSKLVKLGLVEREVYGPYRHLFVNKAAVATFDREEIMEATEARKRLKRHRGLAAQKTAAASGEATMQKTAPLPCKKLHGKHAKNCTQVEEGRKTSERSTPVERREGRDAGASASSLDHAPDGAENRGAGTPDPASGPDCSALDGRCETQDGKTAQTTSKTPKDAPWHGNTYSGMSRDQLACPSSYDEFWELAADDPVYAAMCVTGENLAGGYGCWIKWLNRRAASCGTQAAVNAFLNILHQVYAEADADGIRNAAAMLNSRLRESETEVAA